MGLRAGGLTDARKLAGLWTLQRDVEASVGSQEDIAFNAGLRLER